jgi:hypothetical protein
MPPWVSQCSQAMTTFTAARWRTPAVSGLLRCETGCAPLTVSFFDGMVRFVQILGGTFALGPAWGKWSDQNGRWPVKTVAMLMPDQANGYVCYPRNSTVACDLHGKWIGYAVAAVMSIPCEWMPQVSNREWPPVHCAVLPPVPSVWCRVVSTMTRLR